MVRFLSPLMLVFALAACGPETASSAREAAVEVAPAEISTPALDPADAPRREINDGTPVAGEPAVGSNGEAPAPGTTPPAEGEPGSCTAQVGAAAAQALVEVCLNVSPATRPPCNAANSCAMIEEEIQRGCNLLGEDAPEDCPRM